MIRTRGNKIFVDNLLSREHERTDILGAGCGDRVERQIFGGRRRNCHVSSGKDSIARVWGRHGIQVGYAFGLPDPFVIGKKESAVFNERPANRAAKLIAPEGRALSSFKEVRGV